MAMPGETARPCTIRSSAAAAAAASAGSPAFSFRPSLLIEAARDQIGERRDRAFGVGTAAAQLDRGAGPGGKHHQAHDGPSRNRRAILGDGDLGIELIGELDEARRGARVETATITDHDGAAE